MNINHLENHSPQEIAQLDYPCSCGMRHFTDIQQIILANGATNQLPAVVSSCKKQDGSSPDWSREVVVMTEDLNTRQAAGDRVFDTLTDAGFRVVRHCFTDPELVASRPACDELQAALPPETALLLAVGSGTLNDITKYVSFRTAIPFDVFATAPSMDGYASPVAPLIVEGLKYTFDAVSPQAIIGDIDIIKEAPLRMMSAGFGDIAGKCVSICDWQLSHLVNGEDFCHSVAETVLLSVARCRDSLDGLMRREDAAVTNVMEALVLCGLMMNYVKSSRPASGSEHNLGHFFELYQLANGLPVSMHGEGVAVGSVVSAAILRWVSEQAPDWNRAEEAIRSWSPAAWEQEMQRICPAGWKDILQIEQLQRKNQAVTALPRLKQLRAQWHAITETILHYIPTHAQLSQVMRSGGTPCHHTELPGITKEVLLDGVRYAKDVRYRYSVLQLVWDLGLTQQLVSYINGEF